MKMNQIVFPLALALAATLATTGCKHTPVKVTQIPGSQPGNVGGDNGGGTLPPGGSMPSDGGGTGINTAPGGGGTSDTALFEGMIPDRVALAANTVHFAFDSAAIKKSEDANISAVASALSANANDKLLIEGNCDERGTEEYNRALGERRAPRVKRSPNAVSARNAFAPSATARTSPPTPATMTPRGAKIAALISSCCIRNLELVGKRIAFQGRASPRGLFLFAALLNRRMGVG